MDCGMQRLNYSFNIGMLYKKLRTEFIGSGAKSSFLPRSRYSYLTKHDFFQDVFIKTLEYVDKDFEGDVTEDRFTGAFWTTFKYHKLSSFTPHNKRNLEYSNNKDIDVVNHSRLGVDTQPDYDLNMMMKTVESECPNLLLKIKGYTQEEISASVGVSQSLVSRYQKREIKKLKQTYGIS